MEICTNLTSVSNYTCIHEEEIYNYFHLNKFYINLYYPDIVINPKSYPNFVNVKPSIKYFYIDPKSYKYIELFLKTVEINYDSGVLWPEENSKLYYSLEENLLIEQGIRADSDNVLVGIAKVIRKIFYI